MNRKFRLQKVLEYRERIVDLEKNKLAEINLKLANVISRIETTEEDIANNVNDREGADSRFRSMYDKYIGKLTNEKKQLERLKKQLELNLELQKKKVVESIERHKIMLKLKEKHVENYQAYLNKEEMKMIDELAVTRSARNEE